MELISSPFRRIFQRAGFEKIEDVAVDKWRDFIEEFTLFVGKYIKQNKENPKLEISDIEEIINIIKQRCHEIFKI